MHKKLLEMLKNIPGSKTVVFSSLLALLVLICLAVLDSRSSISDGILAITAIIILWYTLETSMMRQEVTKQNILLTRPIVVIELSDQKAFFRNDGKGPALNIHISEIKVESISKNKSATNYEIPAISYMRQDSKEEMKLFKKNKFDGSHGTVSEPDDFFQIGNSIQAIIRYKDVEGTEYQTKVEIQSAIFKDISFQKIS